MHCQTICRTEYAGAIDQGKFIELKWASPAMHCSQKMFSFVQQLIRKYEIGWAGSEYMDVKTTTTINKPDQPTRITLKRRTD